MTRLQSIEFQRSRHRRKKACTRRKRSTEGEGPGAFNLREKLGIGDTEFVLRKKVKKKCFWCKRNSLAGLRKTTSRVGARGLEKRGFG
ncbi:hypothetical protein RHMOL_Rhmol03G0144500 [Rhododendron molle]|uniref:Uncharacterized protein n=1 Tax=Rhododendron molle TaxID=49168 RepID=A0ACC0PGV5_RHOML|nr:hypothetical protein RHMOL_Rhmol03G0144500 [Rhododendron molle]